MTLKVRGEYANGEQCENIQSNGERRNLACIMWVFPQRAVESISFGVRWIGEEC